MSTIMRTFLLGFILLLCSVINTVAVAQANPPCPKAFQFKFGNFWSYGMIACQGDCSDGGGNGMFGVYRNQIPAGEEGCDPATSCQCKTDQVPLFIYGDGDEDIVVDKDCEFNLGACNLSYIVYFKADNHYYFGVRGQVKIGDDTSNYKGLAFRLNGKPTLGPSRLGAMKPTGLAFGSRVLNPEGYASIRSREGDYFSIVRD